MLSYGQYRNFEITVPHQQMWLNIQTEMDGDNTLTGILTILEIQEQNKRGYIVHMRHSWNNLY